MSTSRTWRPSGNRAPVSKEVKGTITQLSLSHGGYQVVLQFDVPSVENLRVGKTLVVTLPEGKPAV